MEIEDSMIEVDYDLFKTMILNLVDNAVKADCRDVWISGTRGKDTYLIKIRDNGKGIPPKELGRITEAFYMVDKSRARSRNGAGLGLALCTEILSLHDSVLEIESTQGKGTRISFVLQNRDKEAEHEEIDD